MYTPGGDHVVTELPVIFDDKFSKEILECNWRLNYIDRNWRVYCRYSQVRTFMHSYIWDLEYESHDKSLVIDHINRNSLDNRLENLRLVSTSDNNKNRRKVKHKFSYVEESPNFYNKKET